jgi:hypothetical protein
VREARRRRGHDGDAPERHRERTRRGGPPRRADQRCRAFGSHAREPEVGERDEAPMAAKGAQRRIAEQCGRHRKRRGADSDLRYPGEQPARRHDRHPAPPAPRRCAPIHRGGQKTGACENHHRPAEPVLHAAEVEEALPSQARLLLQYRPGRRIHRRGALEIRQGHDGEHGEGDERASEQPARAPPRSRGIEDRGFDAQEHGRHGGHVVRAECRDEHGRGEPRAPAAAVRSQARKENRREHEVRILQHVEIRRHPERRERQARGSGARREPR